MLGLAAVGGAGGCSSSPPAEELGSTSQAMRGSVTFDPGCDAAPEGYDAAHIKRNFQVGAAYMRIVMNSPAFRQCLSASMSTPTQLYVTGSLASPTVETSSPYLKCARDPDGGLTAAMSAINSANDMRIGCDYSQATSGAGGVAGIGAIDAEGRERFTAYNALSLANARESCAYSPDGGRCVPDSALGNIANTVGHELMHAHGFDHVSDLVWMRNNINVGDLISVGDPPHDVAFTLDDFCGVTPAPTPNGGRAPAEPTTTPTPGPHPTYATGLPYQVGGCVDHVIQRSRVVGDLHSGCGANYAGLRLVDSVVVGDPGSTTMSCVADPYVGSSYPSNVGGAPIPPSAPTSCHVAPSCNRYRAAQVRCDENPNFVHLEQERPTAGWSRAFSYVRDFRSRVCAESIYGRSCSVDPIVDPVWCLDSPVRLRPIPFWRWTIWSLSPRVSSKLAQVGGSFVMFPVPASETELSAELGGAGGDLESDFGALGLGVYNPDLGQFIALPKSKGTLPRVAGAAFGVAVDAKGAPRAFAIGGEGPKGEPSDAFYVAAFAKDQVAWSKSKMPFQRARAAVASAEGAVYVVGGRDASSVQGDLWRLDPADGAWKQLATAAVAPREAAAMTVDGQSLVVVGGRGKDGERLGDVTVIDLATGKARSLSVPSAARTNAAVAVRGDTLYVYGGEGAKGPVDALTAVSLGTGKELWTKPLGVSGTSGSLTVDDDDLLTLIPGLVLEADQTSGAFVGAPSSPVLVKGQ